MAYVMKTHETPKGTIVAACDESIVGETFSDGDATLTVRASFYSDGTATLDEIIAAIDGAKTTNFVGDDLITALQDEDVLSDDEVRHVDGVPHAQLYFL